MQFAYDFGLVECFDGLTTEHLLHCYLMAIVFITYLCNLMLLAGYVPDEFDVGITFPIPKECQAKITNLGRL